jgi:hypothetical protein
MNIGIEMYTMEKCAIISNSQHSPTEKNMGAIEKLKRERTLWLR